MGQGSDEPVLDELDYRSVIHRSVGNIMLPREGRDDDIRQAEPKLRGKALNGRSIAGFGSGIVRTQVAM